jgi:hypothetical protein
MGKVKNAMESWVDNVPGDIRDEVQKRFDELESLQKEQFQLGTSVPQMYGSLSRFVANPSTVSVETYKRMIDTDETIGAGIDFMNLCFLARFGDYTHPDKKIETFVRRALMQMEGSWHGNLAEIFSGEWAGFSVTEQVWKFDADFDGAPAFVPKKLVTYPPLTIVFALDRTGEILPDGIFQYQRFHNTSLNSYYASPGGNLDGFRPDTLASIGDFPYPIRISADLTFLTVKIPREKVIHVRSSSTGNFNNPYGRSILRRAYKNWALKDAFLRMWLIAADRKGTPLVIGYAAPNDTVLEQEQNSLVIDGAARAQRSDVAMANAFGTVHNSSFMVLPGKKGETYDVEAVQVQGDMNIYKDGTEYFNKSLMRAMLIPPLIMTGGDGTGSFAMAESHTKMFNKIIDGKLKSYKQAILEQFVSKLLAYNFPRKQWEKDGYGDFALQEQDPELMEKLANVFDRLTTNGYMDPSDQVDMDEVRAKMGLKKKKAPEFQEPDLNTGMDPNDPPDVHDVRASVDRAQESHEKAKAKKDPDAQRIDEPSVPEPSADVDDPTVE